MLNSIFLLFLFNFFIVIYCRGFIILLVLGAEGKDKPTSHKQLRYFFMAAAPEEEWTKLLINGMTVGKGDVSPEEFYAVIKKRIERTLIRTVSMPCTQF